MFNDIYKMLFRRAFFARMLSACDFDQTVAFKALAAYVQWRQSQQIDLLLDHDFLQFDQIKEFLPNGFHEVDRDGRPIFYVNIG